MGVPINTLKTMLNDIRPATDKICRQVVDLAHTARCNDDLELIIHKLDVIIRDVKTQSKLMELVREKLYS